MTFASHASLASCVLFLIACSDAASPASNGPAPESRSITPDGGAAADVADASPARAPGPSFTVGAEGLAIDTVGAPAGQSSSYAAHPDSTTLEGGKPSMLLESTRGVVSKAFAATTGTRGVDDTIAGRRYRMRAKIKTEDAMAAWLWWRIDAPGDFLIDNMGNPDDRRIKGTSDWQEVSLVMDVPKEAIRFAFGSGLTGPGKVWVGAITFEEVGADVPTTPHFSYEP